MFYKKFSKFVFILTAIFLFSACDNNNYFTKNNEIYYFTDNDGLREEEFKVQGVDVNTFQVIDEIYAKDKNYVYRIGKKMEGADPQSFNVLSNKAYSKDKFNVYAWGVKIEGADPESFYLIDSKRAQDKNRDYDLNLMLQNEGNPSL